MLLGCRAGGRELEKAAPGSGVRRAGVSLGPAGWEWGELLEAREEALPVQSRHRKMPFSVGWDSSVSCVSGCL